MSSYSTGAASSDNSGAQPEYAAAIDAALTRLARELPSWLTYHSLAHTRDDVLPAAEQLAALSGVTGKPLDLLRVAAAFHDIGFVQQADDHEAIGIQVVAAVLPQFSFHADDIRVMVGMIGATRLPQRPRTHLEALLADADLDSLGRDDFLKTSLALRAELAAREQPVDEAAWWERQLGFLQRHHYWTAAARRLRDAGQQRNIELLGALLSRGRRAGAGGPRDASTRRRMR